MFSQIKKFLSSNIVDIYRGFSKNPQQVIKIPAMISIPPDPASTVMQRIEAKRSSIPPNNVISLLEKRK